MPHPPRNIVEAHAEHVRRICMAYPEVVEAEQFGGPWWKAGKKSFCIYGAAGGSSGAAFNLSIEDQTELIQDERFSRTGYIGRHGWTTMRFDKPIDWALVEELIDVAYRRVALKRMLKALP